MLYINDPGHMAKMAVMAIYGKNKPLKSSPVVRSVNLTWCIDTKGVQRLYK